MRRTAISATPDWGTKQLRTGTSDVEIRRPSGQQTFFEHQMKQSRRALEQAEAQMIEFARSKGVVSAALERGLTLQKLSEAESADLGLQASIAETTERVFSLESKLRDLVYADMVSPEREPKQAIHTGRELRESQTPL